MGVSDRAADLVFGKEALAAVVCKKTNIEEIILKSEAKIVVVRYHNTSQIPDYPTLSNSIPYLTITDTGTNLTINSNTLIEDSTADPLLPVTHQTLLPLLYTVSPHIIVFLC